MANEDFDLHIGFDWGTSYLSIAFVFINSQGEDPAGGSPRIEEFAYHTLRSIPITNPPTDLYWETNTAAPISGFSLLEQYSLGEVDDTSRLLKYPKLIAHTAKTAGAQSLNTRLMNQAAKLGKSKQDVLKAFANIFYDGYLPQIYQHAPGGPTTLGGPRKIKQTFLAIAVPAGWETDEHEAICVHFRERARSMQISRVMKVWEPEAQLRYLMNESIQAGRKEFEFGTKVLIVDGGGGTTDMILFKIVNAVSGEVKVVGQPRSLTNGMQIVTEYFESDVRKRFKGAELPEAFDLEAVIQIATQWFDGKKHYLGAHHNEPAASGFKVKGLKDDKKRRFQGGRVLYTPQELLHFLDHSITATLNEMRELSHGIKLDKIIFCGGAANNHYNWNRLNSEYAKEKAAGLRIERPPARKYSISFGAVHRSIKSAMEQRYDRAIVASEFQGIVYLHPYDELQNASLSKPVSRFRTTQSDGTILDEMFVIERFMTPHKTVTTKNIKMPEENQKSDLVLIKRGSMKYLTFYEKDYTLDDLTVKGIEVETPLVTGDEAFEASLDDEYSPVNPILHEDDNDKPIQERDIHGFADSDGNPIQAAVTHNLRWKLVLPGKGFFNWKGESQRFINVPHRILLYVNGHGDAKYKVQIEWRHALKKKTLYGSRKTNIHVKIFNAKAMSTQGNFTVGSLHSAGLAIYQHPVLDRNIPPPASRERNAESPELLNSSFPSNLAKSAIQKSEYRQNNAEFQDFSTSNVSSYQGVAAITSAYGLQASGKRDRSMNGTVLPPVVWTSVNKKAKTESKKIQGTSK